MTTPPNVRKIPPIPVYLINGEDIGGGGGGPTEIVIPDGNDVALGETTQEAVIDHTVTATLIQLAKGGIQLWSVLLSRLTLTAGNNLRTAILEALPAGTNVIGGVTAAAGAIADLATLLGRIPAALTGSGNFKISIQESPTGANALQAQGTAADGGAPVGFPVMFGGVDPDNVIRFLRLTPDGILPVIGYSAVGELPFVDKPVLIGGIITSTGMVASQPFNDLGMPKISVHGMQPDGSTYRGETVLDNQVAGLTVSGGFIRYICGYNSGPEQYLQIHDPEGGVEPVDGDQPISVFKIEAGKNFFFPFPEGYRINYRGYVCNSTTLATRTIGALDCNITISWAALVS